MTNKARYIGPDGFVNRDVARETRRGAAMKNGETYEVSDGLFASLMLNADWEAADSAGESAAKEAREAAAKQDYAAANLGAVEGTTYEELVEAQEQEAEKEAEAVREAGGSVQEAPPNPVARQTRQRQAAAQEENKEENKEGGDDS